MPLYKLTKGTLSIIRTNKASVYDAEADGYKLDGEVNEAYEVINPSPFDEHASRKNSRPAKVESDGE